MKLWQKESTAISQQIEDFTVGRDREFDIMLARFDVQGSIAHVTMLGETGLMTPDEAQQAIAGLQSIAQLIEDRKFEIAAGVEDVHSQV